MGAEVERTAEGLQVTGTGTIAPLVADLGEVGELTPVLAALCALADGPSRLTGIGHLRGHETDRLQALDEVLTAVGARVRAAARRAGHRARARAGPRCWTPTPTTAWSTPPPSSGSRSTACEVADPGAVTKTLPDFVERWAGLLGEPVGVVS